MQNNGRDLNGSAERKRQANLFQVSGRGVRQRAHQLHLRPGGFGHGGAVPGAGGHGRAGHRRAGVEHHLQPGAADRHRRLGSAKRGAGRGQAERRRRVFYRRAGGHRVLCRRELARHRIFRRAAAAPVRRAGRAAAAGAAISAPRQIRGAAVPVQPDAGGVPAQRRRAEACHGGGAGGRRLQCVRRLLFCVHL